MDRAYIICIDVGDFIPERLPKLLVVILQIIPACFWFDTFSTDLVKGV